MSSQYEVSSWLPLEGPREFIQAYGLGLLFSANVFGAGSVYILSNTGAQFGFTLLWTMPLALLVDLGMREMSGRLATIDEPLMEYISDTIGTAGGKVLSVGIAFIMHFWAISNFAVGGAALAWLTPLDNVYLGIILTAGVGIALVEMRLYERVEAAIAVLILTVFTIYIVLMLGLDLPIGEVTSGFIPMLTTDLGYLATVVGLFGTTVYYPNFFIQSSMGPEKGWTDMSYYRRDNFVGVAFVVLLSMSVIAVSAMTLDPHTPTLISPAKPLTSAIGSWTLPVFVTAVFLASFSSATGTLFGSGFMVPQAWGEDTEFGDKWFRRTVEGLVVISVAFAILLLEYTAITPVELGITMPAVNGLIGLPITALALYMANRKFFDHPLWMRVGFAVIVGLMFILAAMTAEGLYNQIVGWL